MPAQGELRGPKARQGGGDWDANADDFAVWVEPQPGEQCKAWRVLDHSFLPTEPISGQLKEMAGHHCQEMAPVGSSICTPCHRRRIRIRFRRLSLEHRTRIAEQTGRPLEEIR